MSRTDSNYYDSHIRGLHAVRDELFKLCDTIEEHFVHVGASINDAMRSAPWLPSAMKPRPRSPPPPQYSIPAMPMGYLKACKIWVSQHRALTAAVVAFVGTGVFVLWWRQRPYVKRRVYRAKNGARTQVVVLVGSLHAPLTRSLALDLEHKGFIVYIPISDLIEEQLVQALSRVNIRSLNVDITSPSSMTDALEKFSEYLSRPNFPHMHKLRLASLIILPASPPSIASIADLHPFKWSDTITSHVLAPFSAIHAFCPLISVHKPSILFLTPSIIPSLNPPSHALENVTAGAMQSYISTLRKEVMYLGVNIVHFKLGTFDNSQETADKALIVRAAGNKTTGASGRRLGDDDPVPAEQSHDPLRELHNNVFDAIVRGKGRGGTIFVGQGSRTYDWVSRWVPSGLIGRILEFRKRRSGAGECQNAFAR